MLLSWSIITCHWELTNDHGQCLYSWKFGRKAGPSSHRLDTRVRTSLINLQKKKTTSGLHIYVLRGGYVKGNASQYNGNDLIREAGGGVVAVVIQYRLGLFGFLAGEKIRQEGAVNAGLCKYLYSRKGRGDLNSIL